MNFIKEIEVSSRILELRINRPEALNAMNAIVLSELRRKLKEIHNEFVESKGSGTFRSNFPRAILISGEGGKAFIAGADIADLASPEGASFLDEGIGLMEQLESLPIPVIAVITGFCLGGRIGISS